MNRHRWVAGLWAIALTLSANLAAADEPAWIETASFSAEEAKQAAAADERFFYVITNRVIAKYDRTTHERVAVSSGDAEHLNSGFFWNGRLYCAHSNYPKKPEDSQIMVLDTPSMQLSVFKDFGSFGGSLTWVIRRDERWWCNFALYGDDNDKTFLVEFDDAWNEVGRWRYSSELIARIGKASLSGGVWFGDTLIVTDHDNPRLYLLRLVVGESMLTLVGEQTAPITGQGIAFDPVTGGLVGIQRAAKRVVLFERQK